MKYPESADRKQHIQRHLSNHINEFVRNIGQHQNENDTSRHIHGGA